MKRQVSKSQQLIPAMFSHRCNHHYPTSRDQGLDLPKARAKFSLRILETFYKLGIY